MSTEHTSLAPMWLEKSCFTAVEFIANPDHADHKNEDYKPTLSTQVEWHKMNEKPERWMVGLTVNIGWENPDTAPYRTSRIHNLGVFLLDKGVTEKKRNDLLTVSAPAILFSGARSFIKTITSHGPWRHIDLPIVEFHSGKLSAADKRSDGKAATKKKARRTNKGSAKKG